MRGNGTAHHATNKVLAKEIAALKGQLKKLSAVLEADAHDGIGGAAGSMETRSREAIDKAIEVAQEFIDSYADSASELTKKGERLRDAAAESLVETVQARPLGTLAAVAGIGFVAGYLCRRN